MVKIISTMSKLLASWWKLLASWANYWHRGENKLTFDLQHGHHDQNPHSDNDVHDQSETTMQCGWKIFSMRRPLQLFTCGSLSRNQMSSCSEIKGGNMASFNNMASKPSWMGNPGFLEQTHHMSNVFHIALIQNCTLLPTESTPHCIEIWLRNSSIQIGNEQSKLRAS